MGAIGWAIASFAFSKVQCREALRQWLLLSTTVCQLEMVSLLNALYPPMVSWKVLSYPCSAQLPAIAMLKT